MLPADYSCHSDARLHLSTRKVFLLRTTIQPTLKMFLNVGYTVLAWSPSIMVYTVYLVLHVFQLYYYACIVCMYYKTTLWFHYLCLFCNCCTLIFFYSEIAANFSGLCRFSNIRDPICFFLCLQSPPAVPLLSAVWLICLLTGCQMIVDWHNYGYSIIQLALKSQHPLVSISKWWVDLRVGMSLFVFN